MFKKFGELKIGDPIYGIDINQNKCQFNKYYIDRFDDNYSNEETICAYINVSPLSFDFGYNDSSWHGFIFTTEEEARIKAEKQLLKTIEYFQSKIDDYETLRINIENIKFKEK